MGVDVGTTVIKAVIFSLDGGEVSISSREVAVEYPRPGWAEVDMEVVRKAVEEVIAESISKAKIRGEEVEGVSFSGQGGGLWLIDRQGNPLRKAVIWMDSRAAEILEEWKADGRFDRIYDLTGWAWFPALGPGSLIPWFMKHEKETLDKAESCLWAKDWARYCLTGIAATDETDPSNGHADQNRRTYSEEALELMGLGDYTRLLPQIVPSWKLAGEVTGEASKRTGLRKGTPVATGAWDSASTTLGAGGIQPGQACSILGTAGIHVAVWDRPVLDPERVFSVTIHCAPGRWLIHSLAMLAVANLNWFLREFGMPWEREAEKKNVSVYEVCDRDVKQTPLGARGIIYLPFLQGERSPFIKPTARAVFFGLGMWHTRKDLLRAVYEGVAYSTLDNYLAIQRKVKIQDVRLSGGGARSPVWRKMVADCIGCRVILPQGSEYGCRGGAINAGVAIGTFKSHEKAVEAMVKPAETVEPDPEKKEKYARFFEVYRRLYKAVWNEWDGLNRLTED
jgi:sugar (pentulose or hexulose) kinase